MTPSRLLILVLLGASPVAVALDPILNEATAIELVHEALVSLGKVGETTKVAIYPISDYYAPEFITLQAEVYTREGILVMDYFAVNPWTGDVWDSGVCSRITSPTIRRKQDELWKAAKLPDRARQILQRRVPCVP